MGLGYAANYFARTPVYGWDGTKWVTDVARCALKPWDEFVSPMSFGYDRRMARFHQEFMLPEKYTAIRVAGTAYLVGSQVDDEIDNEVYGSTRMLHKSSAMANLVEIVPAKAASGMAKGTREVVTGTWHCATERVSFQASPELREVKFSEVVVYLPRDCPAKSSSVLDIGPDRYEVNEVFPQTGLTYCRCLKLTRPTNLAGSARDVALSGGAL